ncbi:LacI family DNA-binding transcriptional regulator [Sphingomicrobium lutaoense]|uniref:DNA-binding LacI/PurR family transcriptional regulator n=1 Tax=Sphingomicrobium lutaoense TaxID=515949 RepID=A0A839Z0Q6_9SPHN|nr:LacI family DNA-binding transcriptional regulator [Sphingomicrobium lutaoense]MBB3763145.1 DNA-binding LacI/PurR family transcriptional regulator [Sphingomicrobium lutaoense]
MTQRRPTSFDIAALAGVSQPTVSRALSGNAAVSEETRAKVLAAAKELNYTVDRNASGLRKGQSRTIALLFFEDPTPDDTLINPFYLSMVGAITRACATAGYDLLISFQQLSADWHVDYEDSRKADGIILLGYGNYLKAKPRLEQLVSQGTHFVRWGAARKGQIGTTVGSDNVEGGYLAGRHLVERGRRKIAFIGTADATSPEMLERFQGLTRALEEDGLRPVMRIDASPTEEAGDAAARTLLESGTDFDAIFASSDLAAIGAMRRLKKEGRTIPDDVAIVGFDDIAAARFADPSLTSISQDTRRAAETLVDTLLATIEDRPSGSVLLPVELIARRSS